MKIGRVCRHRRAAASARRSPRPCRRPATRSFDHHLAVLDLEIVARRELLDQRHAPRASMCGRAAGSGRRRRAFSLDDDPGASAEAIGEQCARRDRARCRAIRLLDIAVPARRVSPPWLPTIGSACARRAAHRACAIDRPLTSATRPSRRSRRPIEQIGQRAIDRHASGVSTRSTSVPSKSRKRLALARRSAGGGERLGRLAIAALVTLCMAR